jgi:hypothetical protein
MLSRLKTLNLETTKADEFKIRISRDVLDCFSDKKVENLKKLLCFKTQELIGIDEQILKSFNLFEGTVISFNEHIMGYEGKSTEYGKITRLERSWNIENIKTDLDKTYKISIDVYEIYDDDKSREGITRIVIKSDDNEQIIGYEWPSYYNSGRDMSSKIVKKFDERDMNGLKEMFCRKTLKISDIDQQIRSAIDFFEGRATFGKVNESIYDGRRNYHISVNENENVLNNKPVSTFIEVHIENVETSENGIATPVNLPGKTFEIKFYAYLLNEDNKSYEGISQMIITNNDGQERIIGNSLP